MTDGDAELVDRARRGDASAFEALVLRYLRPAHAVALSVLGEPAEAEDACQDAFIRALERLDDCRDPARFGAWLLRIVRNRAHSVRRYLGVRDSAPLDAERTPSAADPSRDAERAWLRDRLIEALSSLPEVQREVLLLHDLEGWKHREIAEAMDIPEGTSRAHLHHARHALRGHEAIRFIAEG